MKIYLCKNWSQTIGVLRHLSRLPNSCVFLARRLVFLSYFYNTLVLFSFVFLLFLLTNFIFFQISIISFSIFHVMFLSCSFSFLFSTFLIFFHLKLLLSKSFCYFFTLAFDCFIFKSFSGFLIEVILMIWYFHLISKLSLILLFLTSQSIFFYFFSLFLVSLSHLSL